MLPLARAIASLAALLALAACRATPPPRWDQEGAPRRVERAEAELRAWGDGRFEVLSFQGAGESTRTLTDDFDARTMLYEVPFTARVRVSAPFEIEPAARLQKRIGEPGWTAERHRDGVMLLLAVGPKKLVAGQELALRAVAVFEDIEPGWRFRAFDGVR